MGEVDLSVINHDELNCPACPAEPLMEVAGFCSDELADGVCICCPACGFQVVSASPTQAEAAIRLLWDYGLPYIEVDET